MNKYIAYRGFTIRIKLLNEEKQEYHFEIFPIEEGPSYWGNDMGDPGKLMNKYKRMIDRYWSMPETERRFFD